MMESDITDKFMMMAERVIRQRDALVKALEEIIKEVGTSTKAHKIAREAIALVGQQREGS